MLRSEDMGVHYEAVGVLGNLVHSSQVGGMQAAVLCAICVLATLLSKW